MNKLLCCMAIVLLSGYGVTANATQTVVTLQVGVGTEEIGSSIDDSFTQVTASVHRSLGITRNSLFHLSADLYSRSYGDTEIQDREGILGEVLYSYIPTGGYTRPIYSAGFRLETQSSDNIEQEFDEITLILATTLRLDDRTSVTAGFEFIDKSLDDRDTDILGLFVNSDFRINDQWLWYLNLKLQDEDNEADSPVASTPASTAQRDVYAMSHGGGPVTVGNPDLPSSDNTYIMIGVNYALSARHTLDLSFERQEYALSDNNDVEGDIISLDYFFKF
ncbi:MAG: hypothetical protein QNJ69_10875 [Gammaproteobacteria bacterium]|nr:hypothetical protein [Gammaproteobacteria bacterium]